MLAKVNATLAPLLGEEKYRAGVTVDCDMTSGEASEEIYDPEKAVVTSEQKTEDSSGIPLASGVPGTASNLPRPTSRPASSQSGTRRKTESTNYQASRSIRRTKTPQGAIKRISLSVLLDQGLRWEGIGPKAKRVFEVPSPEKIKAIKDVVSASIGLVPDRGDLVIVESLPFDATLHSTAPAAPLPPAPPLPLFDIPAFLLNILPPPLKDPLALLAVIIAADILTFGLALVFFLFRRKGKKAKMITQSAATGQTTIKSDSPNAALIASLGPEDGRSFEDRLAEQENLQKRLADNELARLKMPEVTTQKGKILQQHISDEAKKDPLIVAQILRSWLYAEKEK